MAIKVGINGFGRIGRVFMRAKMKYDKNNDIEVVGINDITDTKTLAHLLKYDSTFGVLEADIKAAEETIVIDGKKIRATIIKDPAALPWKELGVDVVKIGRASCRERV